MARLLLSLIFIIGTCNGDPLAPSGAAQGVPWADYAGGVQSHIDTLKAQRDCAGLQSEFNNADANNAATMSRTGHNNAEMMKYIDSAMSQVGCY